MPAATLWAAFAPASAPPVGALSPTLALPIVPELIAIRVAQAHAGPVLHAEPTSITVAHWGRIDDGELFAKTRYVDWAVRMKRSFGLDVLLCPRCATKMRVLATITQPETIRSILVHLGVRADPLACAPARDPTWEQVDLGLDAGAA